TTATFTRLLALPCPRRITTRTDRAGNITRSAPCARVSAMPFAPESTTTVPAFGQGAPTATSCTSSPPEWTLFAAVSAMRFGPQLTVVAPAGRTRDPVRAAADLVPERHALPDRDHRQIVTVRPRLADAIRARVDHDRVLRPRAGRDHLAIRVDGGDHYDPEEH